MRRRDWQGITFFFFTECYNFPANACASTACIIPRRTPLRSSQAVTPDEHLALPARRSNLAINGIRTLEQQTNTPDDLVLLDKRSGPIIMQKGGSE
ncbi:hypothetical protein [Methanoregula sp.]|uniref:hypothetical protein n=1 Tax=Methanoregula sp. TaxID=2052170 RepID=UPI000CC4D98F|nr:hypothetical protein [Methanoregula sp.]PKG31053.1 MAG: hypothetical protein CW742_15420 [Methanoregula sp.]